MENNKDDIESKIEIKNSFWHWFSIVNKMQELLQQKHFIIIAHKALIIFFLYFRNMLHNM